MKFLVIGIVFNYPISYLLPFFSSLRKYYQGEVCIITPETDVKILNFYKEHNVYVHHIESEESIYKTRHYYVRELLETKYKDIDKVFFTDIRDVYFFNNIFSFPFERELNLFCEPCEIKDCYTNRTWIENSYDNDTLEYIKNNLIICNGTIFATRQGLLNYENTIIKEIEKVGDKFVMDQPITNVLFYKEKSLNAELFFHHSGPIGTFCHDADLTKRNIFNNPACVVHQYDRSSILNSYIKRNNFFPGFNISEKEIYNFCDEQFKLDNQLVKFREFIKNNDYGFGDDAHSYMWKEIIKYLPKDFKFLEIGVYKGQVLCLIKILNEKANVFGVTPLKPIGDKYTVYKEDDYLNKIKNLHKQFNLNFSEESLIVGLSSDFKTIEKLRNLAPFNVVYIDGGHDIDTVYFDIEFAKEICAFKGFIVVDDSSCNKDFEGLNIFTGHKDVSDAVHLCLETDWNYVERLCVGHVRVFEKL